MGKYLNPAHIQCAFMGKGGLARECICTQSTCPECFDAIMGVRDADGVPVFGTTKCGYDVAKVAEAAHCNRTRTAAQPAPANFG